MNDTNISENIVKLFTKTTQLTGFYFLGFIFGCFIDILFYYIYLRFEDDMSLFGLGLLYFCHIFVSFMLISILQSMFDTKYTTIGSILVGVMTAQIIMFPVYEKKYSELWLKEETSTE